MISIFGGHYVKVIIVATRIWAHSLCCVPMLTEFKWGYSDIFVDHTFRFTSTINKQKLWFLRTMQNTENLVCSLNNFYHMTDTKLALCFHTLLCYLNSLPPGRGGSNFQNLILEHMLVIKVVGVSCEVALRWMPQNTFNNRSTLVQVINWANFDSDLRRHIASLSHSELIFSCLLY